MLKLCLLVDKNTNLWKRLSDSFRLIVYGEKFDLVAIASDERNNFMSNNCIQMNRRSKTFEKTYISFIENLF